MYSTVSLSRNRYLGDSFIYIFSIHVVLLQSTSTIKIHIQRGVAKLLSSIRNYILRVTLSVNFIRLQLELRWMASETSPRWSTPSLHHCCL
jgi:hypothetical protein